MQGVGNNIFAPKSVVKGKQLGAVMLRAMGYDVPWDDVDQKLMQLGIPIENKDPFPQGGIYLYLGCYHPTTLQGWQRLRQNWGRALSLLSL